MRKPDTSKRRAFKAPDDHGKLAFLAGLGLLGGLFMIWTPRGLAYHRWGDLLTGLGLSPQQAATLLGIFGVLCAAFVLYIAWRSAVERSTVVGLTPAGLTLLLGDSPVSISWPSVRSAEVVWDEDSKMDSFLQVSVASAADPLSVPDSAVSGDLKEIARLVEEYRAAHSHQAG